MPNAVCREPPAPPAPRGSRSPARKARRRGAPVKVTFVYLSKLAINRRLFRIAPLTHSLLAAYTPADVETAIVDEAFQRIDFDDDSDLVAITFVVSLAPRAYAVADAFRRRGKTVVCGGPHATLMPAEAARHFDAVVIGEGDLTWPRLLEDFRNGRLKRFYRTGRRIDPARIPPARNDLLKARGYSVLNSIQATRGCPHACHFCSTRTIYPGFAAMPVKNVVRQVERAVGNPWQRRVIQFWDDNLIGDPQWARTLFRELRPLSRNWFGQATFSVADDEELVRLAAQSGCKCLFVGLESFNGRSLERNGKAHNVVATYRRGIRRLHDHGIAVYAGIMFGFDDDPREVFETTLEKAVALDIDMVAPRIAVPYPNTPFFARLQRENRILHTDWSRYDGSHAVFRPRRMTAGELERGLRWFDREFHSFRSIARRLLRSGAFPLGALPVNLSKLRELRTGRAGRVAP